MIDAHCHLTNQAFSGDQAQILNNALNAGVNQFISVGAGNGMKDNFEVVKLADNNKNIHAVIGLHPHDAGEFSNQIICELRKLAKNKSVVGIGETGLDYHYNLAPKDIQIESLKAHLQLADELNLPFVIHLREATEDFFNVLKESSPKSPGMLHCFSGDWSLAKRALDHDLYISIPGIITFKKSEDIRKAVAQIPTNRLLIETDAPYLAPVPKRGKRNEPAFVAFTCAEVAKARGATIEEIDEITTNNARRLFNI